DQGIVTEGNFRKISRPLAESTGRLETRRRYLERRQIESSGDLNRVRPYRFNRSTFQLFCEVHHSRNGDGVLCCVCNIEAAMSTCSTITTIVQALTVSLFVTCLVTVWRTTGT